LHDKKDRQKVHEERIEKSKQLILHEKLDIHVLKR
jgi:hypothetical protein